MDVFTVQDRIATALAPLGVDVTTGEPKIGADGKIRRTVIHSTTTGIAGSRRAAGGSVDRARYVNILVVAPSREACLWLAQAVHETLTDLPLGAPHGRLTDASYDGDPLPEPDIAPARWSRALAFQITTKRSH